MIGGDEERFTPLGDFADLGDGLRVRVETVGVDSDELGPWLSVEVRIENRGKKARPAPQVSLYCENSDDGGGERQDELDSPFAQDPIAPGDSTEHELDLLLPLDSRIGELIPKCEGEARIEAATFGRDPNNALDWAEWHVPAEVVEDLNDARPDTPVYTPPPEPVRDPDRPYAWTDGGLYSAGHTVVVLPGRTTEQVLDVLGPLRPSKGGMDDVESVIVAEQDAGRRAWTSRTTPRRRPGRSSSDSRRSTSPRTGCSARTTLPTD